MWINKNYSGSRVAAQTAILFYIIISNDPVMICPKEIDITFGPRQFLFLQTL